MSSPVLELLGKVRPQIAGNPQPNMVVPHVYSFGSLINTAARVYSYRYDEALRHLPSNALSMRRDVFIEALLQERLTPTAQRNWSIWVPDREDPYQKYVAKCVTNAIRAIPRFNALRLYLLEAVWYGRYGAQVNWVQRRLDGDIRWTIGEHQPVNGDKIYYSWDGTPEVAINPITAGTYPEGLVHPSSDRGMRLLRLERVEHRRQFLIHRHVVNDADYFEPEMGGGVHGIGLRSKIYWAWWLRDEMLSWAADFMQKVGTLGLLVFMYEEGNPKAQEKAEAAAGKASTEVALTLAMPPGQNTKPTNAVQHIQASDGGITALRGMIENYFERHIERMIVGQPSSGGTEGNGFGGSAGAAFHADTKYQLLKWDSGNLDETFSQDLVDVMVGLNHSDVDFPVKFVGSVPNPEDAAKLGGVKIAYEMGTDFKKDEVRDLTGMAKPEEGDDTIGGQEVLDREHAENMAKAADAFGAPGGGEGKPGGKTTEPGQGLTANAKSKRDAGSKWEDLAAYADDGSYFEPWIEDGTDLVVTLAQAGQAKTGVAVRLPRRGTVVQWADRLRAARPIERGDAIRLAEAFRRRVG